MKTFDEWFEDVLIKLGNGIVAVSPYEIAQAAWDARQAEIESWRKGAENNERTIARLVSEVEKLKKRTMKCLHKEKQDD
jgi:prefoldin subunit 5